MSKVSLSAVFSALVFCSFAIGGCDDDEDDKEGMCFYTCDGGSMSASIGGITESECNEQAENDDWCDELEEVAFEPGCTECEDCAPDWYECW